MPMRVNHNISALNAINQLNATIAFLVKSWSGCRQAYASIGRVTTQLDFRYAKVCVLKFRV